MYHNKDEEIKINILNNDVFLDQKCWACEYDHMKDDNGICSRCKGVGFELTENGHAILDLIERHNFLKKRREQ